MLEKHKEHGKHRTEGAVHTVDEVNVAALLSSLGRAASGLVRRPAPLVRRSRA